MCGRYVLSLRPSIVRQRLADQDMYADEAPDDDDEQLRQTYNFAPGYHGMIYRAATGDHGESSTNEEDVDKDEQPSRKRQKLDQPATVRETDGSVSDQAKYKLQAAKWGLIPFWTKRPPDYGSQMKTINCRDDSLLENRGMWNTMKQRKRCIVVAEGFYEWLKKNNGKEKIPHFVKRKDGQLMCFAGLWDMVKFEGSDDKLYTYTIITTDSNDQLKFLHDRMPVILEAGSDAMKMWLDPQNNTWSRDLQSLLKPFNGDLECYPVDKGVGKVGNNSPSFIIPIDSKENKSNIANFFGNQAAGKGLPSTGKQTTESSQDQRATTTKVESTEDNAPLPVPKGVDKALSSNELPKELEDTDHKSATPVKLEPAEIPESNGLHSVDSTSTKKDLPTPSPSKKPDSKQTWRSARKARDATSNNTAVKTPSKDRNARITNFFGK